MILCLSWERVTRAVTEEGKFKIRKLTLAKISMQRIGVEGRWAHALSRLHALLVGLAFVVVSTSLLRRGAEPVVRIAAVSMWTYALMRTR